MKRVAAIFFCFFCLIFISGCDDKLSVTKYSNATNKTYEEISGYKSTFYTKNEMDDIKAIKNWLDSCETNGKYYQYIYSDPDSFDMYIYYPLANTSLGKRNYKFSVEDATVKMYITNDGSAYTLSNDYLLIRVQAPLRGSWPVNSELNVDGNKVEIQNSKNNT